MTTASSPRRARASKFDPFVALVTLAGLPPPEKEVPVVPERKWRFDYAWPAAKIALEVEGGVWTTGRHTRGLGFERDCEKYAAAVLGGWRLFRASTRQAHDGTAVRWIRQALGHGHRVDGRHAVANRRSRLDVLDRGGGVRL